MNRLEEQDGPSDFPAVCRQVTDPRSDMMAMLTGPWTLIV
jgi:hypothetical protein